MTDRTTNEVYSPLRGLARVRSCRRRRASSWDRTGGNKDSIHIAAGHTARILEVKSSGIVTHIWCTINSEDPHALRKTLLRMFWDGESEPSVNVPLGDFFGMGFAMTKNFSSLPLVMSSQGGKGMNAYFPLPFSNGARIELVNECDVEVHAFYYYVDYEEHQSIDNGWLRFHAQWRRENPTKGWGDESRKKTAGLNLQPTEYGREIWKMPNLKGEENYVILEAEGRGHYVGCNLNIDRFTEQKNIWYGEGDDMIFIDGDEYPTLNGTGTEDYFNMAWAPGKSTRVSTAGSRSSRQKTGKAKIRCTGSTSKTPSASSVRSVSRSNMAMQTICPMTIQARHTGTRPNLTSRSLL